MKYGRTVAILIALNSLAVACSRRSEAHNQGERQVRASTAVVQSSTIADEFQAPGTIRARTSTTLASKTLGQILSMPFHEGDRVRRGEVVAEIDGREAAAQLRQANAAVTEAQRGLEEADHAIQAAESELRSADTNRDLAAATRKRFEVLKERRSISPQEFEEVETRYKVAVLETERGKENVAAARTRKLQIAARVEQAEAHLEAAEIALGHSRIVSPINGIVTARRAEPGAFAAPGLPLLVIEDDATYELEVAVEESRAVKITPGQKARLEIDALAGLPIDGRVHEIVPAADPSTRTYTIRLQIGPPQGHQRIRSGLFGRAFFQAGERQALVIPEAALVHRGQLEGVYIVQNDVAMLRLVKTGKRHASGIEILSGLESGTRIVTMPPGGIGDGVRIIEQDGRTAP